MEYKLTQTENRLVEMLCGLGMEENEVIAHMLLLPNEQEQREMIVYLEENPEATLDDIWETALDLSPDGD